MRRWWTTAFAHVEVCWTRGWTVRRTNTGWAAQARDETKVEDRPRPTVKDQLRALYKMVHPDLFHQDPVAKAANESSFQLLQEYLSLSSEDDPRTNSSLFNFSFYTKAEEGSGSRKVDISLPPPSRHGSTRREDMNSYSLSTLKALARLFEKCGLDGDLQELQRGTMDEWDSLPLAVFLPTAVELMRQQENNSRTPLFRENTVRTALFIGRKIRVSYAQNMVEMPAEERLKVLEKLAYALDCLPEANLGELTIKLGDHSGIDKNGILWLQSGGRSVDFINAITNANLELAHRHNAIRKDRLKLEKQIANNLGVASIYAEQRLASEPSYLAFLEKLGLYSYQKGKVCTEDLSLVGVRICRRQARGDDEQVGHLDDSTGHIFVQACAEPQNVYRIVHHNGKRAQDIAKAHLAKQENLIHLKKLVRLRLGLRHIYQDHCVSADRFRSCCSRLLRVSRALHPVLEGSSLRVSDKNGVCSDGQCIFIKWDFKA